MWVNPGCNISDYFSLFYGLLSGLGLLLRMFCFLYLTSAVRNKLYYPGDELDVAFISKVLPYHRLQSASVHLTSLQDYQHFLKYSLAELYSNKKIIYQRWVYICFTPNIKLFYITVHENYRLSLTWNSLKSWVSLNWLMNPNAGTETGFGADGSRGCFKLARKKRKGMCITSMYVQNIIIVAFSHLIWFATQDSRCNSKYMYLVGEKICFLILSNHINKPCAWRWMFNPENKTWFLEQIHVPYFESPQSTIISLSMAIFPLNHLKAFYILYSWMVNSISPIVNSI